MKMFIFFWVLGVSVSQTLMAQEATQHNEIHTALERQANSIECYAKDLDFYRVGRYEVQSSYQMTPPSYGVSCKSPAPRSVVVNWDKVKVNGENATKYSLIIAKQGYRPVVYDTWSNSMRVPLESKYSNLDSFVLTIEAFDKFGNSVFTDEYEIIAK